MEKSRENINFTLDETPALRADYEKFAGWLETDLHEVTPQDMNDAEREARDLSMDPILNEDEQNRYADLVRIIGYIRRLRVSTKRPEILAEIAKRDVYTLAGMKYAPVKNEKINDIIYHLTEAVSRLAQTEYKDDFVKQTKNREEANEQAIQRAREKLKKYNVS